MSNYKQEYEKWLNSGVLTEAELKELRDIAGDEREIESRFFAATRWKRWPRW